MELKQRNHICNNLDELVDLTDVHSGFISYLESKAVLKKSGSKLLSGIKNRKVKSRKFYQIIMEKENSYNALCDALQETKQTGAFQILIKLKPIQFDVRPPVHLFTGRKTQLKELHKQMTLGETTTTLITQKSSVTGLGGIGKTELCRKYIQQYSDYYDDNVIWVGAENPNIMANSFKTLAKDYLKISLKDSDGDEKSIESIVDEVYNYFHDRKCLFVFDNAVSSKDTNLNTFMPERVAKPPHILITSRDKDWELPFNTLELDELTESEAITFVKKGLNIEDNGHDVIISELVNTLQRFPLAIQQAISFIREQRAKRCYEIREYLTSFEEESRNRLDYEISPFLSNKYAKTTFTTWKMTTNMISEDAKDGPLAMLILQVISYFQAEEIPIALFEFENSLDVFHSSLQLLVKYSMITCQPKEGQISVHRLVQQVTRIELKSKDEEHCVLHIGLEMLPRQRVNVKSVEHAISIFEYARQYDSLVETFHSLPADIVDVIIGLNRYQKGNTLGEKYLKILQESLSPYHASCIDLEYMLARSLYHEKKSNRARYDECFPLFLDLFSKYTKYGHYQEKEFEVLQCASFVADILEHQKKYKRALALAFPVIRLQIKKFGFDNKEPIETAYTPFVIFLKTHKYKKAISWCRKFLHLYKKAGYPVDLPGDGINTLSSALGSKRSKKARTNLNHEDLFLCDIALHLAALLKVSTIWSQLAYDVADLFAEKGEVNKALSVTKNIYESSTNLDGPDDPNTLFALHWVAKFMKMQGKFRGAHEILKDLKPKYKKALQKSPELMQHVTQGVTLDLLQMGVVCEDEET